MARTPDWVKWAEVWEHLEKGGSLSTCGIHKGLASILRRMIDAGWDWGTVVRRLQTEPGGLRGLADELPGHGASPKQRSEPESEPAEMAVIPRQEAPSGKKVYKARETWEDRHKQKIVNQRAHREREIDVGKRLMDWADRALEVCQPYLILKRKVSHRVDACPHCQGEVNVEEVHIHPSKVDINGIVKAYKEGADRIRIALAMPKQTLSIRVVDPHGELAEHMERMNNAFRQAFNDGIKTGLLTDDGATAIWENARRLIEGARGETA